MDPEFDTFISEGLRTIRGGLFEDAWKEITFPEQGPVKLDPQVVVCPTMPEPGKLDPIKNDLFWKPRYGGLWTSTLDECGGQWVRWLYGEGYSLDQDDHWGGRLWQLTPKEVNLYTVWSPRELHAIVERYPHPELATYNTKYAAAGFKSPEWAWVDWEKASEEYDGVWVPNPWPYRFGISDHAASMFFYSMDAESTCWFRWCFEDEVVELDPEPFLAKLRREE